MADRCTGHCCRAFELGYSPEELRAEYLAAVAGDPRINEIQIIGPMLIYLGAHRSNPVHPMDGEPYDKPKHFYTCRNLTLDGNCAIYEHRPSMCRDFPYAARCRYQGCEWDDARQLAYKTLPVLLDDGYVRASRKLTVLEVEEDRRHRDRCTCALTKLVSKMEGP